VIDTVIVVAATFSKAKLLAGVPGARVIMIGVALAEVNVRLLHIWSNIFHLFVELISIHFGVVPVKYRSGLLPVFAIRH
jgi:hypothetical protein